MVLTGSNGLDGNFSCRNEQMYGFEQLYAKLYGVVSKALTTHIQEGTLSQKVIFRTFIDLAWYYTIQ